MGMAAAVAGSARWVTAAAHAAQRPGSSPLVEIVDTNVTLGQWPFRRFPLDETAALTAKLRQQRVTQAWAGSFDALLQEDVTAVNARLTEQCRRFGRGLLVPFGTVNLCVPGWQEEVRRCSQAHRMPGLRLHPNYHGYQLGDPAVAEFLSLASEHRLILQIALSMEDERMQHPQVRVPHVDATPLVGLLGRFPDLPIVLLNWPRAVSGDLLKKLAACGAVHFDIASVESVGGVANLLMQVPRQRVLFGSFAPLFYFESATLKLRESALGQREEAAIRGGNARRLLTDARTAAHAKGTPHRLSTLAGQS